MAALSDHDRRDADSYARNWNAQHLRRYQRRMDEASKTYNKEKLDEAARTGQTIDPVALGFAAHQYAMRAYFGVEAAEPHAAIEASSDPADGFA